MSTMDDEFSKVHETYERVQLLKNEERPASFNEMQELSSNWKDAEIPSLQRQVVNLQLANLRKGLIDPVFASLKTILTAIPLNEFTFLDAACATGYYSEVIQVLDSRRIQYRGSDYSAAMIEAAASHYPQVAFDQQDLTKLTYADKSFDVVMAAGVLEHIPDYKKAIAEICRVARTYIILHRCPLTGVGHDESVIGAQYNILTPRVYFSEVNLIKQFELHGFRKIKELDVYNANPTLWDRALSQVKLFLGKGDRAVKSFLFERKT